MDYKTARCPTQRTISFLNQKATASFISQDYSIRFQQEFDFSISLYAVAATVDGHEIAVIRFNDLGAARTAYALLIGRYYHTLADVFVSLENHRK